MTRVLVCGGRDYQDRRRLHRVLDAAIGRLGLTMVISGGAMGADHLAQEWAERLGIPTEIYKAHWGKDGPGAGPIRNSRMLAEGKPDLVIAFPGGNGTADMVAKAERAGVRVIKIDWSDPRPPKEGQLL